MSNCLKSLVLLLFAAGLAACQPPQKPEANATGGNTEKASEKAAPSAAPDSNAQTAQSAEPEVLIPVQADKPRRGSISAYFETPSRIEAENRVQVMAEGVGDCVEVRVEEGDRVRAGDVLAELDKTELQATIGQTQVQVRQQKTALDIAERSLAEGIGSKVERDNARFAHEQSLANLNAQNVRLAKLTIRAPISGIVTKRNIQAGQMVAGSQPVFSLVDPSTFMVVINPPEKDLPRLEIGQPAKVTIDAFPDQEFAAKVRRINPSVDSVNGTVKVVLDFDAAIREKLRDGAFSRVRLVLATHDNSLLIAKDTLVEENARKYVFVVTPASAEGQKDAVARYTANRVEVQTGLEDSNSIEVLSGIDDASLLVTLGQHTLKSGSTVTVTNAQSEISTKGAIGAEEALKAAQEERKNLGAKKASTEAAASAPDSAAKEQAEKERVAKEQAAKDAAAKEQAEKDRVAKEHAEKEQAEKDRVAKEEAAKALAAKELAAKELAAKEAATKAQATKNAVAKDQTKKKQPAKAKAKAKPKAAAKKPAKKAATKPAPTSKPEPKSDAKSKTEPAKQ